jgi:hypothetical protein
LSLVVTSRNGGVVISTSLDEYTGVPLGNSLQVQVQQREKEEEKDEADRFDSRVLTPLIVVGYINRKVGWVP